MIQNPDTGAYDDPEALLRRRVVNQQTGNSDPTGDASGAQNTAPATTPAPFDDANPGTSTPPPAAPGNSAPAPEAPIPAQPPPDGNRGTVPPTPFNDLNPETPIPLQSAAPSEASAASPSYGGGGDQSILQLLQSGMDPQQASALFNQKNGRTTGNEAVYYNDSRGQTIGLPSGYAALTPGGWTWTVRGPEGPAASNAPAGGAPRVASSINPTGSGGIGSIIPRTTTGATDGAPNGLWGPDFTAQLRQLLMQRIAAAGQPVDPNSPQIAEPLTAARDQATRQTDQERTQLAEHLYAQGGLNTDAIGQQIQQSNERNAVGLGTLRGNLISKEIESRKTDLRDLMQMALASGDAEAAREIQLQLSELNAILQRENMGVNLAINETNQNANTVNSGGF